MNSLQNLVPKQIALDGPSASGKTTVGKKLACRLGFGFLDTGMMYRAVTLLALRRGIALTDAKALGEIAEGEMFEVLQRGSKDWRLVTGGEDLTDKLNSDLINRYVSEVSATSEVRRGLVRQQRRIAKSAAIVMVGRDIGTVVLADAPLKVYLAASAETRALRRVGDTIGNADQLGYDEVLQSIKKRDEIDSTRVDSPLRPADDAVIIDTDNLSVDQVVDRVLEIAGFKETAPDVETLVGAKSG